MAMEVGEDMKSRVVWAVFLTLMASASMSASLWTIPGGTLVPMPADNYSGGGPITFGPGITWTSTNVGNGSDSLFGLTSGYGFGANGDWTHAFTLKHPMAGLNDSFDFFNVTDTMTFAFASPVAAIGGFLNYYPDAFYPTTIAVYDAHGNLIESSILTFTFPSPVPDNSGMFLGFKEQTADISYFTLTDNYIGITDLRYATATPEPGSILLLGSGALGALGFARKRFGI